LYETKEINMSKKVVKEMKEILKEEIKNENN
jgi:hypothetical protein